MDHILEHKWTKSLISISLQPLIIYEPKPPGIIYKRLSVQRILFQFLYNLK